MKKISFLAAAITVALTGCGGSDGDSGGDTPAPSFEINDTLIQESMRIAQSSFFYDSYFNLQVEFVEYKDDDNVFGVRIDGAGARCSYGVCPESINVNVGEEQLAREKLDSLYEQGGGTVRYRTADEVNGIDLNNPVDSDGQSRLQTIIINNNEVLTPERRQMILDAVAQIQAEAGVQLFNDEVLDIDLSQITVDDYIDDLTAKYPDQKLQFKNTWLGNIYNTDGTVKYDATSATDVKGDVKNNDSFAELVDNHGIRGGIIVSWGTAMATTEVGCTKSEGYSSIVKGNVSGYPYIGNEFGHTIDKNGYISNSNVLWVNLGQFTKYCHNVHMVNNDIIVHELGHAVGLQEHFNGFGVGAVWDDRAKSVLRSLYNTPVGTPYDQMTVVE